MPDEDYPLRLTTGRTVSQFHTRTKTGRVPELQDAAPQPWVELSAFDAQALGISDGDWVRVASRRGAVDAPARVRGNRAGVVFVPFHYGYWDESPDGRPDGRPRAANELTITEWDPVSKQPLLKVAAVRVERLDGPR
jgi:anaerobic selenocysteine-containing dehydrogenase